MTLFIKFSSYRENVTITRTVISLSIGLISGFFCFLIRNFIYQGAGDFAWALLAARDLLSGNNPYGYHYSGIGVPYPLTVAFIGIPFAWLPDELAAAVFFGLSSSFLAYGLLKTRLLWKLLIFLSPSYLYALAFVQWSPLLVAMSILPLFLFMLVIKPHMAAPLALSGLVRWKRSAVGVTVFLILASLLAMPTWPFVYLNLLQLYEGVVPVMVYSAGGPLLLFSLLKWRDPKARLLLLMSLVPQRMFYDQLPLWLLPVSKKQMIVFNLFSWLGFYLFFFHFRSSWNWQFWIVFSIYIPALLIVFMGNRVSKKQTLPDEYEVEKLAETVGIRHPDKNSAPHLF
jgi:hypothetical protein